MAYTQNEKSTGLDTLITLANGDLVIVGDVSDSGRAKAITFADLAAQLGGGGGFVQSVTDDGNGFSIIDNTDPVNPVATFDQVALANDNTFTTALGNNANFISTLTSNASFQTAVNSFVSGGGGGGSAGFPKSFSVAISAATGFEISAYQNREFYLFPVSSTAEISIEFPGKDQQTYDTTLDWADADEVSSYVVLNDSLYIWLHDVAINDYRLYRYDIDDLSLGGTQITFAGGIVPIAGTAGVQLTSDGVSFYLTYEAGNSANDYDIAKYSLSGTVLTYVSTITCGAVANLFDRIAVLSTGEIFAMDDSVVNPKFARFDSAGVLIGSFGNYSGDWDGLLNWSDNFYLIDPSAQELVFSRAELDESTPNTAGNILLSLMASEDLTAGDPVGISNLVSSSVAKGPTSSYTASTSFVSNNSVLAKYISIDTDKGVLVYRQHGTSNLYAAVFTVDRTDFANALTFGTEVLITNDFDGAIGDFAIHKLDTDKFAVAYLENAPQSDVFLVGATVAGLIITLGVAVVAASSVGAVDVGSVSAAQLGTDKGVLAFSGDGTAGTNATVAYTFAGTVPTVGAQVVLSNNMYSLAGINVSKVATDKFVCVSVNSPNGYVQLGTTAGTVITAGASVAFSASVSSNIKTTVSNPVDDTFTVSYANSKIIAATVAGTVPTFGAAGTTNGTLESIYVVSPTEVLGYSAGIVSKNTIAGNVISNYSTVIDLITTGSSSVSMIDIGGYFAILRSPANPTGDIAYFIEGMANGFIGIAQSTVLRGSFLNVLIKGTDTHQSGLSAGSYYGAVAGAWVLVSTTLGVDTANEVRSLAVATSLTNLVL